MKIAHSTATYKKFDNGAMRLSFYDNASSIEAFPDATTHSDTVEALVFELDIRGELFTE